MRVVVVGGGIVGMFVSYYLLKSGCSVTIVDRQTNDLASKYNSGLIVPSASVTPPINGWGMIKALSGTSHPITISVSQLIQNMSFFHDALSVGIGSADKLIMDLAKQSLALFLDFQKTESIDADVVKGVLIIYNRYADAEAHSKKLRVDLVDSNQLEKWGYVGFGGAAVHDDEIALNPGKLVPALRAKLQSMGATVRKIDNVRPVNEGNGLVSVEADGDKIQGDAYVIAAGSWSKQLCRFIGYDIPLLPARGFVMLFDTKGSTIVQKPAILEDVGAAFSQHGSNVLRVASYYEMVGFDNELSRDRKDWLMHVVKKHLTKNQDLSLIETGCGFRPCTSDQIPIVGQIPGFSNAYIATGHARLGVTLSAVTGYALDSMINKKPMDIDMSRMSPSRFIH